MRAPSPRPCCACVAIYTRHVVKYQPKKGEDTALPLILGAHFVFADPLIKKFLSSDQNRTRWLRLMSKYRR